MTALSLPFPLPWSRGSAATVPAAEGWLRPGVPLVPPAAIPAPADRPDYRRAYPRPLQLELREPGAWCPHCDTRLRMFAHGWFCASPGCGAAWDFQGLHGCWRELLEGPA